MEWEWTWGNILTFVGTGVALIAAPTVFQVFWGKPHLSLKFETVTGHEGRRLLICAIENRRGRNRALRLIGAHRPVEVRAAFDIVDALTGEKVVDTVRAQFRTHPQELTPALNLIPPHPTGLIVVWHHNFAAVLDQDEKTFRILLPSTYIAKIAVHSGDDIVIHRRQFVIGVTKEMTKWAD